MLSNKLAIGTLSLGQHPSHDLDAKIRIAARNGYSGVEIVYADLKRYADTRGSSMIQGSKSIRELCEANKIEIIALAPFENFDGHQSSLKTRLGKAQEWMNIARALGAKYLQVPAQYSKDCTGNQKVIVSELQQLSDLGRDQEPMLSVAYEPMSWSTHVSTWQTALQVINDVDRVNFGLCLDSFHILTKLWGCPYELSGKYPNADEALNISLNQFKKEFPLDKLFYVQLSDGEKFDPPFSQKHPWFVEGEAAEFTWSKHARPFPGEVSLGAYLPVGRFLKECVADKNFSGWVSMEIFDRRMRDKDFNMEEAAIRGRKSWDMLQHEVQTSKQRL